MASYKVLEPAKNGKPRIKITVELGYDEETGKRLRKYKTVTLNSLSERTIKKALTEFEIEVANTDVSTSINTITFREFVQKWLDNYVRVDLSVKTKYDYLLFAKSEAMNDLGDYRLSKIKTFHIVEFINKWKAINTSKVYKWYAVLKSIFAKAVEWKFIEDNPMSGVKKPRPTKKHTELQFYDEQQLKKLFEILKNESAKNRIRIKLAALCGLRLAEIAGITTESIDFNNNTITIDKTLQVDEETRKLVIQTTKNKKARKVNIPKSFAKELKEYVTSQRKLQLASGNTWEPFKDENGNPVNFLFTRSNGYPLLPKSLYDVWRALLKKYKLPHIRFHDLRHSYASFMISHNVNFKIIQEQLGHSDIQMTLNTYSHLTEKDKQNASDLFDEIL